jgi:uncharacterized protein (DUF983 family)
MQEGEVPRTELWSLPANDWERFLVTMRRAFTRRCPYCGSPGIYEGYLTLRHQCPRCGVVFEREEGYFLGGYAINLIVAEFLGLGLAVLLLFKTALRDAGLLWQEIIIIALAVIFPLLFFPYSRGVWMALDLTLHPPWKAPERQLRGVQRRDSDAPH